MGVHHDSTQPIENIVIGVVLHVKNELEDFSLVDKVVWDAYAKQNIGVHEFFSLENIQNFFHFKWQYHNINVSNPT